MKKLLFVLGFCCSTFLVNAQVDVKVNPIALLFTSFQGGVELPLSNDFGMDGDLFIAEGAVYFTLAGKYYFNPEFKTDGFHFGAFTSIGNDDLGVGIGFLGGYKWFCLLYTSPSPRD